MSVLVLNNNVRILIVAEVRVKLDYTLTIITTHVLIYNGYTPQEISEKFEMPNLRPLPDKPFEFGGSNVY